MILDPQQCRDAQEHLRKKSREEEQQTKERNAVALKEDGCETALQRQAGARDRDRALTSVSSRLGGTRTEDRCAHFEHFWQR